nr:hypothetical protein [Tanacetum cinerariifolium]
MPYLRFTKAIIHHFMSQDKSIFKREGSPYHTIADDGLLERFKFISKGELYQVYGKPIPDTWVTDKIKEEQRQVSIKIKISKVVVIQEPSSAPTKKIKESFRKLKGIELVSEAAHLELETQKEIKESQRTRRLKHKTGSSREGTGVSPGVLDELVGKSTLLDEGVSISLKRKIKIRMKMMSVKRKRIRKKVSEEAVNKEESVSEEENVDGENEEDTDDNDKSFDITNTDDERIESDSVDHEVCKEGKTIAKTEEEETANSDHEEDDTKDKEITSMMDIEIQQDVRLVQNEPFHEVKVSVIPKITRPPPSTPPAHPLPAIEDPATPVINFEAVDSFLKKFHALEKDVYLPDAFQKGLETKKRRTRKDDKSLNKSPTHKESTKGKPSSKSSKTGKSTSADQSIKVNPKPKIQKKDWFKDSPKPEALDPEWNIIKAIDDTPE